MYLFTTRHREGGIMVVAPDFQGPFAQRVIKNKKNARGHWCGNYIIL